MNSRICTKSMQLAKHQTTSELQPKDSPASNVAKSWIVVYSRTSIKSMQLAKHQTTSELHSNPYTFFTEVWITAKRRFLTAVFCYFDRRALWNDTFFTDFRTLHYVVICFLQLSEQAGTRYPQHFSCQVWRSHRVYIIYLFSAVFMY